MWHLHALQQPKDQKMVPHPQNPLSTSPAEWAKAFLDAYPSTEVHPLVLSQWFICALEAGYAASEAGRDLYEHTAPPAA